jgi:FkbM family methyltransferase
MNAQGDLVAWCIWQSGALAYEKPLPLIFCHLAARADTVVSVGASSGFYELLAAASSNSSRVFAFECYPPALARLRENLACNGFAPRIKVIPEAVTDSVGTMTLFVPPEQHHPDKIQTNASLVQSFHSEVRERLDVTTTTLDAFTARNELTRLDVLRIDAEGSELQVLRGADHALEEFAPFVFLEVLGDVPCAELDCFCRDRLYIPFAMRAHRLQIKDRIEAQAENINQLLCPRSRLEELADYLKDAPIALEL